MYFREIFIHKMEKEKQSEELDRKYVICVFFLENKNAEVIKLVVKVFYLKNNDE